MADEIATQPITEEDKRKELVRKLEPYLKMGLSIRKACLEAGVPRQTLYDMIARDKELSYQIEQLQQYTSVITSNAIVRQLLAIISKQQPKKDANGKELPIPALTKDDIEFLQWYALNSKQTREEFGVRKDISVGDPEAEVQRLLQMIDEEVAKANKEQEDKKVDGQE